MEFPPAFDAFRTDAENTLTDEVFTNVFNEKVFPLPFCRPKVGVVISDKTALDAALHDFVVYAPPCKLTQPKIVTEFMPKMYYKETYATERKVRLLMDAAAVGLALPPPPYGEPWRVWARAVYIYSYYEPKLRCEAYARLPDIVVECVMLYPVVELYMDDQERIAATFFDGAGAMVDLVRLGRRFPALPPWVWGPEAPGPAAVAGAFGTILQRLKSSGQYFKTLLSRRGGPPPTVEQALERRAARGGPPRETELALVHRKGTRFGRHGGFLDARAADCDEDEEARLRESSKPSRVYLAGEQRADRAERGYFEASAGAQALLALDRLNEEGARARAEGRAIPARVANGIARALETVRRDGAAARRLNRGDAGSSEDEPDEYELDGFVVADDAPVARVRAAEAASGACLGDARTISAPARARRLTRRAPEPDREEDSIDMSTAQQAAKDLFGDPVDPVKERTGAADQSLKTHLMQLEPDDDSSSSASESEEEDEESTSEEEPAKKPRKTPAKKPALAADSDSDGEAPPKKPAAAKAEPPPKKPAAKAKPPPAKKPAKKKPAKKPPPEARDSDSEMSDDEAAPAKKSGAKPKKTEGASGKRKREDAADEAAPKRRSSTKTTECCGLVFTKHGAKKPFGTKEMRNEACSGLARYVLDSVRSLQATAVNGEKYESIYEKHPLYKAMARDKAEELFRDLITLVQLISPHIPEGQQSFHCVTEDKPTVEDMVDALTSDKRLEQLLRLMAHYGIGSIKPLQKPNPSQPVKRVAFEL